ncbi:hypothetical protein [Algibacillus agarilyticus]|uniref:hypothetical protein n=1 Tax=Algibacillus agarilyticus TaxID=2234133 RepID=UPI000DCF9488|nr:hypothetical protein [Algibacillus agarilyticus]
MKDSHCYGVLLCFYEDKVDQAIKEFENLISSFNGEATLIIINNSNVNVNIENCHIKFKLIEGDNENWEFSGWQKGQKYILNNFNINKNDLFIFANDTFNSHRNFTFIDRHLFIKAAKKINIKTQKIILGEQNHIHNSEQSFMLFDKVKNGWVSTYLFAVNYNYISNCNIDMGDEKREKLYYQNVPYLGAHISKNLFDYIINFLTSNKKGEGWYGKSKLSSNPEIFRKKYASIINEKSLSINADCIIDVYNSRLAKFYQFFNRQYYARIKCKQ